MLLGTCYNDLEIHRRDKIVFARFLKPHRVISTCRGNGGLREDLSVLFNHQSCEPCNHKREMTRIISHDPKEYLKYICGLHDLDHEKCASLGTAANMNYAAMETLTFRELTVVAVCTGGVEANAGRAGDPAHFFEFRGEFERLVDSTTNLRAGTINIMLFISKPLSKEAMVRTIVTATEAKTAALQELNVNSRYSDGLATGTGTDQIGVACRMTKEIPLTSAGKHSKLGELVGKTVKTAIKRTLALQNELTPEGQRSVKIHIERFGTDKKKIKTEICRFLSKDNGELLTGNFEMINRDPLTVAAVAAIVHLWDKFMWGILPKSCMPEIFSSYGAQIASAISGKIDRLPVYREKLADVQKGTDNTALLDLIFRAMAMGFEDKWD